MTDDEFNDRLKRRVEATYGVMKEPADDYCPTYFEDRCDHVDVVGLPPLDDSAVDDWGAFFESFAAKVTRKWGRVPPQAVFVAFLERADGGGEALHLHGATGDGRRNRATIAVSRDEEGRLVLGGAEVELHPISADELRRANYAARVFAGAK